MEQFANDIERQWEETWAFFTGENAISSITFSTAAVATAMIAISI